MRSWVDALARFGPDPLVIGFIIFLVFSFAGTYGVEASLALGGGALFLYVISRYALLWIRLKEARERLKLETQKESLNLFNRHSTPAERDVMLEIEEETMKRRKP